MTNVRNTIGDALHDRRFEFSKNVIGMNVNSHMYWNYRCREGTISINEYEVFWNVIVRKIGMQIIHDIYNKKAVNGNMIKYIKKWVKRIMGKIRIDNER